MKITNIGIWMQYTNEDNPYDFDENKCGKWMYYFDDMAYASKLCKKAIENNVVGLAKHRIKNDSTQDYYCVKGKGLEKSKFGVACFYLNIDDVDTHKAVITFFIENQLIQKTKAGKLHNISFKLDSQTRNREYDDCFQAKLNLSTFLDLETGKWIYEDNDKQ